MTCRMHDRWLWLGVGVALFITVKGISYAISDILRLTAIEPLQDEQDDSRQTQPEDSLSLDVLKTLATSPNPNISKSATDLITARCVKAEGLVQSIRVDAASSDPTLQRKARTAMKFLRSWTVGIEVGNMTPPGIGNLDGTMDPELSPSVLSIDDLYEPQIPPSRGRPHQWAHAQSFLHPRSDREDLLIPSEDDPVGGWAAVPRERNASVDAELRRRRREAMVLHEGMGGLGEDDIIRPRMR